MSNPQFAVSNVSQSRYNSLPYGSPWGEAVPYNLSFDPPGRWNAASSLSDYHAHTSLHPPIDTITPYQDMVYSPSVPMQAMTQQSNAQYNVAQNPLVISGQGTVYPQQHQDSRTVQPSNQGHHQVFQGSGSSAGSRPSADIQRSGESAKTKSGPLIC